MDEDSPYVYRDERSDPVGRVDAGSDGSDIVIVDGRAVRYRRYRR